LIHTTQTVDVDGSAHVFDMTFTYDSADRLVSVTYPDGEVQTQTYDDRGFALTLGTVVTDMDYNILGAPVQLELGNGLDDQFGYYGVGGGFDSEDDCSPDSSDCFGRLYRRTISTVVTEMREYDWDGSGNVVLRTASDTTDVVEAFTLDFNDRLTDVANAYTATHAFDEIGNITALSGAAYTYDANGNMLTRGGATMTWDAENRLRFVDVGGVHIATYTYDRDGNRVKKEESGETTVYIGKYYEKNVTTGTETLYYFLGNKLVGYQVHSTVSSDIYYLHQDHLGSTTIVTDADGDAVFERSYDPWGNTRTESGTATTDRLYTGQRYDAVTGLYYYNARYYDPTIARFISPDTIVPGAGDPQGWNR
jgi:RHS repeat-associated protein